MKNVKNKLEHYILEEEGKNKLPEVINIISEKIKYFNDLEDISKLKDEIFINKEFHYKKTDKGFFQNIENKIGDCLDFSLLYHFIFNRINFPNNIISVKGHTMIKFPFSNYLLETTENALVSNKEYIKKRNISLLSINKGIYLSVLKDEDVFAIYLNKKSKHFMINKDFPEALKYLNKSLNFSQKIPEAFYNKGILLNKTKDFKEALKCFEKSIELDPNFYEAINNAGISYAQIGYKNDAKRCFKTVYRLAKNPERKKAKKNIEILKSKN